MRRYDLCRGDVRETPPRYLEEHPETLISLAYFDLDLYEPTRTCLKMIRPRLLRGAVLAFMSCLTRRFRGRHWRFWRVWTWRARGCTGSDSSRTCASPSSGRIDRAVRRGGPVRGGAFVDVAELVCDPSRARVYEHGWQSWSPTGIYPATATSARPIDATVQTIVYRPSAARPRLAAFRARDWSRYSRPRRPRCTSWSASSPEGSALDPGSG